MILINLAKNIIDSYKEVLHFNQFNIKSYLLMRYTYIVQCNDNTLYTGITTDLTRRMKEHNESTQGASYTRGRRPVSLIRSHQHGSRSEASREEYYIKQLTLPKKLAHIQKTLDEIY